MKSLFQFLTLRSAVVSAHRKRQFILTAFLLLAVLLFRLFSLGYILDVSYAVQALDVVMYTLMTHITFSALRIFVVSGHRRRRNISSEEHDNFTVGVNAMVNAATVLATTIFIFVVFDIEFRSFLSSVALFAVALTIIFQDFIKNFLFGFAIMFSTDYEIGDYIQVGNMPKGVIRNVTFSSVQLKTESGDILYIPNAVVRGHEIVNFSKLKPKRVNVEFCLLRSQIAGIDAFEQALLAHLDVMYPTTFEREKCRVYVKESNKDDVTFVLDASTKKASLKLKEQVTHSVQKFAVEYRPG